jgi:UDP-glucose 4-epimerase
MGSLENRIFVTGGAGFIGSHAVKRLLASGKKVTVFDNFSSGSLDRLGTCIADKNITIVKGDLLDQDSVKTAMADQDTVFHFASNPDIMKSMNDPRLDLDQGIIATYNLLNAMRLADVKRIVYASGSGVYGDFGNTPLEEDHGPMIPISMYGASKLACEGLICAFCHMFGLQSWIFRFANVVGDNQTHGVVFDFIRKLSKDPSVLNVLGDGSQSKSYIFVEDVLDAIFLAWKKSNKPINIFNVSTLDYITVREIARIVTEEMRLHRTKIVFGKGKRGWRGDIPVVRMRIDRISRLGWRPKFTSKEAMIKSTKSLLEEFQASLVNQKAT